MNWKHIATILTGVFLPAVITALNGHPLTMQTLETALAAGMTALIGVLLTAPKDSPQ